MHSSKHKNSPPKIWGFYNADGVPRLPGQKRDPNPPQGTPENRDSDRPSKKRRVKRSSKRWWNDSDSLGPR